MNLRISALTRCVALIAACGGEDDGTSAGDSTPMTAPQTESTGPLSTSEETTVGTTADTTNVETSDATDSQASTSAASEDSGPDTGSPALPECHTACTIVEDCCVDSGDPESCLRERECVRGACERPAAAPCEPGAACGQTGTELCVAIDGVGTCVIPCEVDSDCPDQAGLTCSKDSDDAGRVCFRHCALEAPCNGLTCDEQSGECYCEDDAQCGDGRVCV